MKTDLMADGKSPRLEAWAVAGVLLLFVCLGVAYSLVVPPFEKPDEVYHYAFARHLAEGNGLPIQTLDNLGPWAHEGTQAPLYYLLLGRLTARIDQSDLDQLDKENPRANLGDPLYPGNKNLMLYSARSLPLRGANLAMHAGRWFSLALACLSLFLVYLTARLAFPQSAPARLLAMLIVAAIPQFAFIGSSASNDSLIILVSAAMIYWLARLLTRTAREHVAWWEWAVTGVLLGLAGISKLQGLALLAPIGMVVLWLAWRRRSPRLLLTAAPLIILPAVAIAGWWYWRNFTLYGDWLGADRLLEINGQRSEPLTWSGFLSEMRGLRYSFWGLFGWFSILLPDWVYKALDAITVLALAGFVGAGIRSCLLHKGHVFEQPARRVHALLAFWAVTLVASMIYWATFATSSQGRLLFPALSAFGIILVAGLLTWVRVFGRWQWVLLSVLPLTLLACSAYALSALLPGSYDAPSPIARLPEGVQKTNIVYGGDVELVGIAIPEGRFRPGDDVPITLYLRAPQKLPVDLQLFVQLLDENGEAIGNVTTHPGWGRNPTSLWQPNALYEDRYLVRIDQPVDNKSPLLATVYVGFTEPDSTDPLPAVGGDGQPSDGMLGKVAIEAREKLDPAGLGLSLVATTFEQGIRLAGVAYPAQVSAAAAELPVKLLYRANAQPNADYTGFLHLTDSAGKQVSGHDQPPGLQRFPTHAWRAGDTVMSEFTLPVPPGLASGTYQLWTGLYLSESKGDTRLGVVTSDRLAEDMSVLLGTVEIR
ncbi:MAG: phospholipid carrier-dependent glycosyltransferase [Nitrososphaerales archaeon]